MKELQAHKKHEIIIDAPFQQKSEMKYFKSLKLHKGLTCYQLELSTGKISEAKFDSVNARFNGEIERKIIVAPGFIYAVALNEKTAWKKFCKMVKQTS